ncbi:hypothetical protein B0H19DRAFT_1089689 [Mycena capillaripes]|nr:hypothetical protein B0H19DRAFT_1089689 [Mycena capillaripes]
MPTKYVFRPHARLCALAFLLCAAASFWYSDAAAAPADPTLRLLVFELKPTLAAGWLFLDVRLLAVYGIPRSALELQENTDPAEWEAHGYAVGLTRYLLVYLASFASFSMFRYGVPWPQTGDWATMDAIVACALYFLHGLANCLALGAVGCGVYYATAWLRASARGVSVTDEVVILEKGAEK